MSANEDEVAKNLASLNELVTEMMFALAEHGVGDIEFARMARSTLRDHSWALGFDFQGEHPPLDAGDPADRCACGIARRYHLGDGTIQPNPWSDETCDGFTPAQGGGSDD